MFYSHDEKSFYFVTFYELKESLGQGIIKVQVLC